MDVNVLFYLAQFLGALGVCSGVAAMWMKDDKVLLTWMLTCNVLFMAHYVLLGSYMAAGVIVMTIIRLALAKYHPRDYWLYLLCVAAIVQFIVIGQAIDVLILVASLLGNVAYFRFQGIKLRVALLVIQLLWVPIAIDSWAVFALVFNALSAGVSIVGIARLMQDQKAAGGSINSENDEIGVSKA